MFFKSKRGTVSRIGSMKTLFNWQKKASRSLSKKVITSFCLDSCQRRQSVTFSWETLKRANISTMSHIVFMKYSMTMSIELSWIKRIRRMSWKR